MSLQANEEELRFWRDARVTTGVEGQSTAFVPAASSASSASAASAVKSAVTTNASPPKSQPPPLSMSPGPTTASLASSASTPSLAPAALFSGAGAGAGAGAGTDADSVAAAAAVKKAEAAATAARVELARAKIQSTQLQTQIETLGAEKAALETRARAALDELAVEKAQRDQRLVRQVEQLTADKQQLQTAHDAAGAALSAEQERARQAAAALQRSVDVLLAEKAALEAAHAAKARDAAFRHDAERTSLEQQLAIAHAEADKLKGAQAVLQAQVDALMEEKHLAELTHGQTLADQEKAHTAASIGLVQQLSALQIEQERDRGGHAVLQTQIDLLKTEKQVCVCAFVSWFMCRCSIRHSGHCMRVFEQFRFPRSSHRP